MLIEGIEHEAEKVAIAEQISDAIRASARISNKFAEICHQENSNLFTIAFSTVAFDMLMARDNEDWAECHKAAQTVMKGLMDSGQLKEFMNMEDNNGEQTEPG